MTLDLCAGYWPDEATRSVSDRLRSEILTRFLAVWRNQDDDWVRPDYHNNGKIVGSSNGGLTALACDEPDDLQEILRYALMGVLDVLDQYPPEGDSDEGATYGFGVTSFCLRFGTALKRATGGAIDLLSHPIFDVLGDFPMHLTQPDGGHFDFGDNPAYPRGGGRYWDFLSLLAKTKRRGDWARTARMRDDWTLERLLWDDPDLESADDAPTAACFPTAGVVTMRSGWDADATYVGLKSGRSTANHSHLDSNSFVVSARGQRLLIDEGLWEYTITDFFDTSGPRFDFDANATIGHNTLMVDGKGQLHGPRHGGAIVAFDPGPDVDVATADASTAYGSRLGRYLRTLVFVKPSTLLVLDEVRADRPRYLEWLFHFAGKVDGDENVTIFTRNGVALITGARHARGGRHLANKRRHPDQRVQGWEHSPDRAAPNPVSQLWAPSSLRGDGRALGHPHR